MLSYEQPVSTELKVFMFYKPMESLFPSLQANELLQSSRQIQNKLDKERTLKESLRLYQQISHHTDLPLVCAQYRQGERLSGSALHAEELNDRYITHWSSSAPSVRFYEGVVELCLTAADKKDPQKLGPHFYRNGEPEEDSTGQQAFQERSVHTYIHHIGS